MYDIINRIKADLINYKKTLLILIIILLFLQITFNNVCPMKIIFGIPCPACGLTHSCFYILTFRWRKAFESNPTGFLWFISIITLLYYRYVAKVFKPIPMVLFIISAIASVLVYFYKLLI